jgi:hypothetical protein
MLKSTPYPKPRSARPHSQSRLANPYSKSRLDKSRRSLRNQNHVPDSYCADSDSRFDPPAKFSQSDGLEQVATSGLHLGDQVVAALSEAGQALGIGAIASAICGGAMAWLMYKSPGDTGIQLALYRLHLSPNSLIFAAAALATVWALNVSPLIESQRRLWLTISLVLLGYGAVWYGLPRYTPSHRLYSAALLLMLITLLSLGLYRRLWLKAIILVGGTMTSLMIVQHLGLLKPETQLLLLSPVKLLGIVDEKSLLTSVGLLAILGGLVGFWLSLSQAISRRFR